MDRNLKNQNNHQLQMIEIPNKNLSSKKFHQLRMIEKPKQYLPSKKFQKIGNGLLDPFIKQGYTTAVQNVISKHADEIIVKMTIVRTPLQKALNILLNVVSFGQYEKAKAKNKYDDYFHLHLNVITNKGTKLIIEKNEVINVEVGHKLTPKSEVMPVSPVKQITLKELMDNAKEYMGKKFFTYNAKSNNCQYFVMGVLNGSGMTSPQYKTFALQDTESIFKNSPIFRKLANTATDIAAASTAINDSVISKGLLGNMVPNIISTPKKNDSKITKLRRHLLGFGNHPPNDDIKQNINKLKVAELKSIIKDRRKDFDRKVYISGKSKKELIDLVNEII
jgi:hypothetical protein